MPLENEGVPGEIADLTPEQAQTAWNEVATERGDPSALKSEDPALKVETPPVDKPEDPAPVKDPVLARLEQLEEANKKLANDLKMASGRVSKMQGELDAGRAAAKAVKDAPTAAQQAAASADPAKWTALKEEFPEWTDAMDGRISERIAEAAKTLAAQQQPAGPDAEAHVRALEIRRVARKHPDWDDVRKSDDFKAWRATQSEDVNALATSDLADDAIEMFDLFKASKTKANPEAETLQAARAARLKAASGPAPRQTQPVKSGGELTPQEIWAQEAEARAKRRAA